MGFINLAEKTINAKLVYYGCGMGGKTTSLQVVHEIMCPRNEVQLVSIKTEEDATLLFDFLPIDLGNVGGFKVRIQGFTVPGQPKYRRMRRYVLSGADAVVFVVDSDASRLEENLQSFESLLENLRENGIDTGAVPVVLQYNKRDLDDVLSEEELDRRFRIRDDIVSFPSVATQGHGVFEAFVEAAGRLVDAKVRAYGLGRGSIDPADVAEGARAKLWEIYDRSEFTLRSRGGEAPMVPRLELTFDEGGERATGPGEARSPVLPPLLPTDGEVLTEADLELALPTLESTPLPVLDEVLGIVPQDSAPTEPRVPVDDQEPLPELLGATVASNLELAQKYGELDRYRGLLEQKNREMVEVAQNVVHDLNRPLSALRLMLSSMRKGYLGTIDEVASQAVDTGLRAVHVMERLIQDLLESSRLEFDGIRLEFREVDLHDLVAAVAESLHFECEEKGVEVHVERLPRVRCDEWAMTRVFANLLGNAIQYASNDRSPRVHVSASIRDNRWILMVSDNGIGIPAADISRLFQRFERGSNTGGITGTGLGLHIVREIVLGHGGEVWVESTLGAGTTFFLALPFAPVQPPHSRVSDSSDPALATARAAAMSMVDPAL